MTLSGILAVDKAQGWTSHDVVARVRRIAGQRQVGHAGTLDPLATGVLLVVLGRATRLSAYLMDSRKEYAAEVVLGATTVTDDAEGTLLQRREVEDLSPARIEACLAQFVGEIDQIPPAYAAVRHNGEKLYKLARKGIEVQPEPRQVRVDEISVECWRSPRLRLRVRCGPGTYIRSLARDVGEALGMGGYLHALRRVASGGFRAEQCCRLDGLERESLEQALLPPDWAVSGWPAAVLTPEQVRSVLHGHAVSLGTPLAGDIRLYEPGGGLLALARPEGSAAKPFLVLGEA